MQVISALTNMLEEVCCSSRLAYKKKEKKKKITFIYVCTKLENTIQNTTTCLNQLCQCCGYESCFVEKLTMTHFQVLKVRTHMSGSETNLNPVKDPLVVSPVLDQSVQLSGQICSAELLLLVLLRLIAQCKLHILQRERERGASWSFFTTFVTSHAMRIFLPFILHYIKCDERIVTLHIGLED